MLLGGLTRVSERARSTLFVCLISLVALTWSAVTFAQPAPVCGDGVLEGNEECDDGNKIADDGCDDTCKVKEGYFCPIPGEPCLPVNGSSYPAGTDFLGDGPAGLLDEFDVRCPSGTVLAGLEGTGCDDPTACKDPLDVPVSFLRLATLRCVALKTNPDGTVVWDGAPTPGDSGGKDATPSSALKVDCPTDQVVVGFDKYAVWSAGLDFAAVYGAGLICAPLKLVAGRYVVGQSTGDPVLFGYMGNAMAQTYYCADGPYGQIVNGINGGGNGNDRIEELRVSCVFMIPRGCGDGVKNDGEECDDGNTVDGDGCSKDCKLETGFFCPPNPELQNGDFESGPFPFSFARVDAVEGWTTISGDFDLVGANGKLRFGTPNGVSSLDLNGMNPGALYQEIETVPGETYVLAFLLTYNSTCGGNSATLGVALSDGDQEPFFRDKIEATVPASTPYNWESRHITFQAVSTTTRIAFASLSSAGNETCGPVIDYVRVYPICRELDTDGDGLTDNTEDKNKNGVVDPGETDPKNKDSDGDKLPDGWIDFNNNSTFDPGEGEDKNLNGILDSDETDPTSKDTDKGGVDDGTEVLIDKTDPLDGKDDKTCSDKTFNGQETDVDCGGPLCAKCSDGKTCRQDSDCLSGSCDAGVCRSCGDGVKNGDETDVDCGGSCDKQCGSDKGCTVNTDCASNLCQNGACTTCGNGVRDGDEGDVDCGGSCTDACDDGKKCRGKDDCKSGVCSNGVCISCNDGKQNGDETDVDCGGSCDKACDDGKMCREDDDCASKSCFDGLCAGCTDGVKNGDETDVDCGGTCTAQCDNGKSCLKADDCKSGICSDGKCGACDDGVKNGDETDVDCGGSCSTKCTVGKSCSQHADCESKVCNPTTKTCAASLCPDASDPADCDGDLIPNWIEDKNQNGVVDPDETDPMKTDSDGDKIPDGIEDHDHDGIVDSGETDPARPDSDGDGVWDGDEDLNQNGKFDPGERHPLIFGYGIGEKDQVLAGGGCQSSSGDSQSTTPLALLFLALGALVWRRRSSAS